MDQDVKWCALRPRRAPRGGKCLPLGGAPLPIRRSGGARQSWYRHGLDALERHTLVARTAGTQLAPSGIPLPADDAEVPDMKAEIAYRFAAAALALSLLRPVHAAATEYEEAANIRAAAELAVRMAAGTPAPQLIVTVDSLDARLRLNRCAMPLRATIAGDGQLRDHTTVAVRCESTSPWSLYIGAALASQMPVLVAQRALARDAVPAAADFATVLRRLPGLSSHYISDPAQLAGQRLRREVALGEALTADALLTAPVVRRGQQLTLLAHASGMDVRVTVVALADGKQDERIRVQNPGSQRVIEATVRSAQLVEVSL
jgi:flagella basal body P-ring formation protein FlgA